MLNTERKQNRLCLLGHKALFTDIHSSNILLGTCLQSVGSKKSPPKIGERI